MSVPRSIPVFLLLLACCLRISEAFCLECGKFGGDHSNKCSFKQPITGTDTSTPPGSSGAHQSEWEIAPGLLTAETHPGAEPLTVPISTSGAPPSTEDTCVTCNRKFKNTHGLNIHIARVHKHKHQHQHMASTLPTDNSHSQPVDIIHKPDEYNLQPTNNTPDISQSRTIDTAKTLAVCTLSGDCPRRKGIPRASKSCADTTRSTITDGTETHTLQQVIEDDRAPIASNIQHLQQVIGEDRVHTTLQGIGEDDRTPTTSISTTKTLQTKELCATARLVEATVVGGKNWVKNVRQVV